MIEESEHTGAEFRRPHQDSTSPGTIFNSDHGKVLREAFSSQAYYDEFCMLINQLSQ